ncbi:MAG: FG-GAP-like repeat-containing protein [Pigmentiphaga sp.]|nr:FG-GAP-like repeat-containing protein [Pigmentiphaga sp.]
MKTKLKLLLGCILLTTFVHTQIADKNTYLATFVAEMYKQWPGNKTQNLVFHGHSVPTGYYTAGVVKTLDSYPFYTLKALKNQFQYAVINCIITSKGGEHAKNGAIRFASDALSHKPDVVFIDYSLNDRNITLAEAKTAWSSMIEAALQKNVKVILLTPTPDTRENILSNDAPLKAHADQVRELAAQYHVGLVDSYGIFKQLVQDGANLNDYMAQANHINELGHQLVANEIVSWFTSIGGIADSPFVGMQNNMIGSTGPAAGFDFNNDLLHDLIYSDGTSTYVYQNQGNSEFLKINQSVFPAVNAGNIISVDINNDGKKELFISGISGSSKISKLYEQNANNEWVEITGHNLPVVYSQTNVSEMENTSVCFADINNDGYVDFLSNGINDSGETVANVYLNNKNKTFVKLNTDNLTPGNAGGIIAEDFNNDGYPDLVLWGYNPTVKGYTYLYKNNGDNTFTQIGGNLTAKSWSAQVVAGDFNGDGKKDFAMISWETRFFLNNNNNFSFTQSTDLGIPNYTRCSAAVHDFNGDGCDDMVIAGLNGSLPETKLFLFNPTIQKYNESLIADIGEYGCVVLSDFNQDGKTDLFVSGNDITLTSRSLLLMNTMEPDTPSKVSESGIVIRQVSYAPNPAKHFLHIQSPEIIKQIIIHDLSGKIVYDGQFNHNDLTLNSGDLRTGNYLLTVKGVNRSEQHKIQIVN